MPSSAEAATTCGLASDAQRFCQLRLNAGCVQHNVDEGGDDDDEHARNDGPDGFLVHHLDERQGIRLASGHQPVLGGPPFSAF